MIGGLVSADNPSRRFSRRGGTLPGLLAMGVFIDIPMRGRFCTLHSDAVEASTTHLGRMT
jgi:hypothetical protein